MSSPEASRIRSDLLDRIAIGLSGLCLVHCVATVLLLTLIASVGGALVNPLIHEVGLALAILIGLVAFVSGYRVHRRLLPLLVGGAGLCSMGYALTLRHGVAGEVIFTIVGVLLVATAHHFNRRSCAPVSA